MRTVTMDKELLIRMPTALYRRAKKLSQKEYKSISALVRELLLERLNDTLTPEESAIVKHESKLFHKGKGTNWRKIKRA